MSLSPFVSFQLQFVTYLLTFSRIIHSLKPKISAGYDERTSIILKTCAIVISHPLSFICKR